MNKHLSWALMLVMIICSSASSCNERKECVEKIDPACMCPMHYDPVCGCNEKTYGNSCQAECSGIKEYTKGECPPK